MSAAAVRSLCAALGLVAAGAIVAGQPPPRSARSAVAIAPAGEQFVLEVVADARSRAIGYMGREYVGPNEGMLFVFEEPGRHGIWMKNCRVELDVLWLDARFRVVHVERALTPCPPSSGPCPSAYPPVAASYVLELAAGSAARAGLTVGQVIAVVWEEPAR